MGQPCPPPPPLGRGRRQDTEVWLSHIVHLWEGGGQRLGLLADSVDSVSGPFMLPSEALMAGPPSAPPYKRSRGRMCVVLRKGEGQGCDGHCWVAS